MESILRVGGRLSKLSMPVEHKNTLYNHMLSKLREKYSIVDVSSAVREVMSKLVRCPRLNALPLHQQMAELPEERIISNEPPFTGWELIALARLK